MGRLWPGPCRFETKHMLCFFRVFRIRDLWCWLGPLLICSEGCIASCAHHDIGHRTLNLLKDLESLGLYCGNSRVISSRKSFSMKRFYTRRCKRATPRTWPSLFSLRSTIFLPPTLFCPLREEGLCVHCPPWTCTKTLRFWGLCPYNCRRRYCIRVWSDVMIT